MALLAHKTAVISGGAGSLGLACAKLFAREGANVILLDLSEESLNKAAAEVGFPNVMTAVCDVSNADAVAKAFETAAARWGKIDVILSNAGNQGPLGPLKDYPEDGFDQTLSIHVKGAFLACKYGSRHMTDGGSIIITSSVSGVRGGGGTNIAYVAAKHGQIGIMRSAARSLAAQGIRVNSINPGPIDNSFQTDLEEAQTKILGVNVTDQLNAAVPMKRHARPEEIAGTALFLASDLSSYVTGAVIMADGGLTG